MEQGGQLLSSAMLESLREYVPHIKTRDWRKQTVKALKWAARRGGCPRDFAEIIMSCPFNPDAYVVNREERFLHFFEIEVYNPMRFEKLLGYADLWWDLEYDEIDFAVLVVNRYGHLIDVDLTPYKLHRIREFKEGKMLPPTVPPIRWHEHAVA